jgi:hypothetical protein
VDDAGNLSFRETGVVNIVPPFGFYDCGNIGDKAMLNGFASPLAQCACAQVFPWKATIRRTSCKSSPRSLISEPMGATRVAGGLSSGPRRAPSLAALQLWTCWVTGHCVSPLRQPKTKIGWFIFLCKGNTPLRIGRVVGVLS